ncbi:MAG: pilus assembly protein TadG-related protein [Fuerstiella sp.]
MMQRLLENQISAKSDGSTCTAFRNESQRGGIIIIFAAILLVAVFAFVSFTVDIGYVTVVRSQLQSAADAAALGSAQDIPVGQSLARSSAKSLALLNEAGGKPVVLEDPDIELGFFDFNTKSFVVDPTQANAVRVTARADDQQLFFAPIIGHDTIDIQAQSIAMLNPRDIVFAVDLSGSMNDDTEPCWATDALTARFTPTGYPTVANDLMQQVYNDFGYGNFPGDIQHLGAPLGVSQDRYAYAEMTKDDGPLANPSLPTEYRIDVADSELTRKTKAYRWLIDNQIRTTMPAVTPAADSSTQFEYWSRYLDYIANGAFVGEPPPPSPPSDGGSSTPPPSPPSDPTPQPPTTGSLSPGGFPSLKTLTPSLLAMSSLSQSIKNLTTASGIYSGLPYVALPEPQSSRIGCPRQGGEDYVYLPPNHDGDRIYRFNNPNTSSAPSASAPWEWRNKIGYRTYVQFMMDWGRNRSPDVHNGSNANPMLAGKTPLSALSPLCPRHNEMTAGGTFSFPPRAQPMHAVRRSLIAGIKLIADNNEFVAQGAGDRVSIVTFDGVDNWHQPTVVLPLTDDFNAAMQACTNLQAASDIGATTATEAGLNAARQHLVTNSSVSNPGGDPAGASGRKIAKRVIVLLTDGMPNLWETDAADIDSYIMNNGNSDYYATGYDWLNAPLIQASRFQRQDKGEMFSVGMGLGADYDFLDRMARTSKTANGGFSPRGSGNPAQYEATLIQTLESIILRPGSKLVQ